MLRNIHIRFEYNKNVILSTLCLNLMVMPIRHNFKIEKLNYKIFDTNGHFSKRKMFFPRVSFADFYLWANPQENDSPNISVPPIRTADRKAEAAHSFMPALVTRSL